MTQISIEVRGVSGVTRKLTAFDKWLTVKLPELTKTQAREGAQLLVQLMPHRTGAMAQAVSVQPNRKMWAIVSRTPSGQIGGARPYHIWYNDGKRGWYKYGRTRTGQYHYYETTAKYLNGAYPRKVMNDLKRVLGGK